MSTKEGVAIPLAVAREERNLEHIPGDYGLPIIGNTLPVLFSNREFSKKMYEKYGPVYRNCVLGQRYVALQSVEAAQRILTDKDSAFSSKLGWNASLGAFFSGGLMLRDFEDHRFHRRIVQLAFRRSALDGYIPLIKEIIQLRERELSTGRQVTFYPYFKRATLETAARAFLGVHLGDKAQLLQDSFLTVVKGTGAFIRRPVPGLTHWRGLQARRTLEVYLREEIARRRGGDENDLFSQLCRARDQDGATFTDEEIVNHMIFFMVAAHDTTAAGLTNMAFELARSQTWQDRCREEAFEFDWEKVDISALESMPVLEASLRETLRLHPSVPTVPRRTVKPCEFHGYPIPTNTTLFLNLTFIHRLSEHWPNPDTFDPNRFLEGKTHDRHPFAWFPFGGGAHLCSGFQLADLQVKLFFSSLLTKFRLELTRDYTPDDFATFPFPKPKDNLPLALRPL